MFDSIPDSLILVISVISSFAALLAVVLSMNMHKRTQREEDKKTKAELSLMREELERQLYRYNDKIASDYSRWVDINHLLFKNINNSNPASAQNMSDVFFRNMGIEVNQIIIKKDLVFLLTPFHKDFKETTDNIRNVCGSIGLKCIKGDEDYIEGNILKYIVEKMMSARIIIANISGRNPNVLYELGIAHAIGKPTILISKMEDLKNIPFDIQSNQLVLYRDYNELNEKLIKSLSQILISAKGSV
ncbi:hypothetical protein [Bacteroides fluxus]|uniref:hypothetical protein n=1 Tax=Bacteroides fluxus TaxID=626930 RepID=UPI002A7ECEFE|nr:hypothetical protein [Bacteroides fluxus]MDY3788621.1 hypothetical protein [Bacteroides fluxus]